MSQKITSFAKISRIPISRYYVDASWSKLPRWLELFSNEGETPLVFDPPYQRGYVWSISQKIAFLEFKLRGGRGGAMKSIGIK